MEASGAAEALDRVDQRIGEVLLLMRAVMNDLDGYILDTAKLQFDLQHESREKIRTIAQAQRKKEAANGR